MNTSKLALAKDLCMTLDLDNRLDRELLCELFKFIQQAEAEDNSEDLI